MKDPIVTDDLSREEIADPTALSLSDIAVKGGTFVIPIDAPVPGELADVPLPTGTLYSRLRYLAVEDGSPEAEGHKFRFVPVSGMELLQLERAWRLLQTAKRVYALFGFPGARYDVMFTQAARQIGLHRVEWPEISTEIAAHATHLQRTQDAKPWAIEGELGPESTNATRRRLPRTIQATTMLEEPESDENP